MELSYELLVDVICGTSMTFNALLLSIVIKCPLKMLSTYKYFFMLDAIQDNSITGFRIPTSVDKSSIQVRNRAVSTNTIYCDVYFIVCSSYEQFCLQICSTMQASVPIYLLLCGLDRDYILYQRFHNFELDCYDLH